MGTYQYNLNSIQSQNIDSGIQSVSPSGPKFGRVIEVILNEEQNGPDALGAVKYISLGGESSNVGTAYPQSTGVSRIPIVNEIITLLNAPGTNLQTSDSNKQIYYSDIVKIWNHPHHNAFPFTGDSLGDFNELADINPLQPNLGDVYVEGRHGQSIRFTDDGTSKPLTIISNGQKVTDNGFTTIEESISEDPSSLWLTNGQTVEINTYTENQAILTSDRVILNSRENTEVQSDKSFKVTSVDSFINSSNGISLDAPRIEFGSSSFQPVIKGDAAYEVFDDMIKALVQTANQLKAAAGEAKSPSLAAAGSSLSSKLEVISGKLSKIRSTKTFVE